MIFQKFLQNNKWQHKDPAVRLEAIGELNQSLDPAEPDAPAVGQIIIDIARTDTDESVRLAAIAQLISPDVLRELSNDPSLEVQHAARVQYCRVVSAAKASPLTPAERLALMQDMANVADLLAVLHDCGCDDTGLATLERLRTEQKIDEDGLVNIAAHSSNHVVRHAAALGISESALLEKLATLVRHKDKTVYKHCRDILQMRQEAIARQDADIAMATDICALLESLTDKMIDGPNRAQFDYKRSQWQELNITDPALQERFTAACAAIDARIAEFQTAQQQTALQQQNFASLAAACASASVTLQGLQSPLTAEQIAVLEPQIHALQALYAQRSDQEPEDLLMECRTIIASGEQAIGAFHALEAKSADLEALHSEIAALTAKHTAGINATARRYHKLFSMDAWPESVPHSALFAASAEAEQQLQRLQNKNKAYLEKLHKDSLVNIAALEQHVEQGQVNEAQRLWDKVQGAIKNADDTLKKELQEKVAPFKSRINELMDWKNFAATEKKKELIGHMQALIDGKMHAADKAKRIKSLQDEWKKLGHSLHNDALWAQFNELSHVAFEPCKEYFKERKTKLHTNLEERNRICAQLEELVASLTPENLNIASLNKIESKALEDWKLFAPVEQSKIKKLQKRFNSVLTALRLFKRKTLQANATRKLELIAQAEQLDTMENVKEAMAEAKKLQALWKSIGPSPYKDDRNHWNAFRAACDKIFTKRPAAEPSAPRSEAATRPARPAVNPSVSAARDALRRISDLLTLSSEELAQSKKQFAELKDAFLATLTPDLKNEKKALLEQFDKLSKSFDNKLRAAPDKKSLQLIGQVRSKADFCEKLEADVLAGKPVAEDADALAEQWQALGRLADLMQEQALEQRFHALSQGIDARVIKKQSRDNEDKAREICIAAEIHAGIESPDADKPLRMQVQLKQLKNSFGKTSKSSAQLVNELELQLLCLGPLDGKARQGFEARLAKAKEKV